MSRSTILITLGSPRIFKPEELRRILRSLEVDEGIRIEGAEGRLKMFVSRSPSGLFAAQLVGKGSHRIGSRENIEYLNSVNDVMSLVQAVFSKAPSFCLY
jgi:hypothetical protein